MVHCAFLGLGAVAWRVPTLIDAVPRPVVRAGGIYSEKCRGLAEVLDLHGVRRQPVTAKIKLLLE